jgi:hypothetical protein
LLPLHIHNPNFGSLCKCRYYRSFMELYLCVFPCHFIQCSYCAAHLVTSVHFYSKSQLFPTVIVYPNSLKLFASSIMLLFISILVHFSIHSHCFCLIYWNSPIILFTSHAAICS